LIKAYLTNGQDVWLLIHIEVQGYAEKGYTRKDILLLYKFIDWLLTLPDEAEKKLYDEIITYEEDQKMPYVTTAERIGMQKGIKEGIKEGERKKSQDAIVEVLETRFECVSASLKSKIKKIEDLGILSTLLKKSAQVTMKNVAG
jgi:hypothetical protein